MKSSKLIEDKRKIVQQSKVEEKVIFRRTFKVSGRIHIVQEKRNKVSVNSKEKRR